MEFTTPDQMSQQIKIKQNFKIEKIIVADD